MLCDPTNNNLSFSIFEKALHVIDQFVLVALCKNNNINNDFNNNNNINNNNTSDSNIIDKIKPHGDLMIEKVLFINTSLQHHLGWKNENNNGSFINEIKGRVYEIKQNEQAHKGLKGYANITNSKHESIQLKIKYLFIINFSIFVVIYIVLSFQFIIIWF